MAGRLNANASRIGEWAFIIAVATLKLWLASSRSLGALGNAQHDDFWFLGRAMNILEGRWLGDYNHLTLIKGPVYPLWVAFIASQRIPLLFAQQLLYAIACLAVCIAVAPAIRSRVARCSLFAVLLFNPMTFADDVGTRVIREGIYPALVLLVFATAAGATLRIDARRSRLLLWTLLHGVALALFWHTREEGVWILPLLAFTVVALLVRVRRDPNSRWRRAAFAIVLPCVIWLATHATFVLMNGMRYGVYAVVEFKEKSFLRAYGSLTHVRAHPPLPRIPIPREARERVYAVSPAFAELRPFIEGVVGERWTRGGPDFPGEAFMWLFRESVEHAGYYSRGSAAVREYYDRLSTEIEAARISGRLDARPARATLVPPLQAGDARAVVVTWMRGFIRMLHFPLLLAPQYSDGPENNVRKYADMTRTRLALRKGAVGKLRVKGWALHVNGGVDVSVEDAKETPVPGARVVTGLPSQPLYDHLERSWKPFPPARNAIFELEVPPSDAYLVLRLGGRVVDRISLNSFPLVANNRDVRMGIISFEAAEVGRRIEAVEASRLRILQRIARVYQIAFPFFFFATMLLYWPNALWLARQQADWTMPLLIAGLLAAVAARVLILALIDVTSFAVFMPAYESPSHPLALAAAVLAAHLGLVALSERRRVRTKRVTAP